MSSSSKAQQRLELCSTKCDWTSKIDRYVKEHFQEQCVRSMNTLNAQTSDDFNDQITTSNYNGFEVLLVAKHKPFCVK